jgi:hypothetical protein
VLSVVVHLPLSPIVPLLGLAALLMGRDPVLAPPVEELVGIPVELIAGDEPSPPPPDPGGFAAAVLSPSEPVPSAVKPKPKPKPRPVELDGGVVVDGGLDGGLDAGLDGGVRDAGTDAGAPAADAGDAGPADAGLRMDADAGTPDPLRISGSFADVARADANVRVHFFVTALRQHPAGLRIGELLSKEPQWRDLLGTAGVDPLRDLDKVFLYGSQLARSADVRAFLEFGEGVTDLRGKVDAIVKRSGAAGKWTEEGGKSVGRGVAAGAPRVFVLYPDRVVGMMPESGASDAVQVKRLRLPEPTEPYEVVTASAKTPHRIYLLQWMGLKVPESIASVRVTVLGTPNGGAVVRLVAIDASTEQAQSDAAELLRQLKALTGGLVRVTLEARGREIHGDVGLSPLQIAFILNEVGGLVDEHRSRESAKTAPHRTPKIPAESTPAESGRQP